MNRQPGTFGAQRGALLLILLAAHASLLLIGHSWQRPGRPLLVRPALSWLLPLAPQPAVPDVPLGAARPARPVAPSPEQDVVPATIGMQPVPSATGADVAPGFVETESMPLRLGLPLQGPSRRSLAPAPINQAIHDPRSNSPRLSASERFAITLGSLECVLDERQPDGTVRRFEGRLRKGPSTSGSLDPFGHSAATGGGFGDVGAVLGGTSIKGTTVAECVKSP